MKEPKRILVVEDDSNIRDVLKLSIQCYSYEVKTASNGKEAIEILQRDYKPHLILTDIMMPEMNGYELVEKIWHLNIPVVMMSGAPDMDTIKEMIEQNKVRSFILKPLDLTRLITKIRLHARKRGTLYGLPYLKLKPAAVN